MALRRTSPTELASDTAMHSVKVTSIE
jgi:hypothetical protein